MRTVIHTPTPNLGRSVDYWQALGFRSQGGDERCLLNDAQMEVEIDARRSARAGVRLIQPSWQDEIARLREITPVHEGDDAAIVVDPSGVWIYLSEEGGPGDLPPRIANEEPCVPGTFAGLSLETADMKRSACIWEAVGFAVPEDLSAAWVSCKNDEDFIVTWMAPGNCPHLFFNPSLTFFNSGRNPEIIAILRETGVPLAEEITVFNEEGLVDNVILQDPGGYGMFVFND
ncbi:MAG: hypothetical protein AAGA81_20960 [Acidobacteriota bacterium]